MSKRWIDDFLSLPYEHLYKIAQTQIKRGYIPILIDKLRETDWEPPEHKCITPASSSCSVIMTRVRSRYNHQARGLTYFVNNELIAPTYTIGQIYERHKTKHGFLVIEVAEENCFG